VKIARLDSDGEMMKISESGVGSLANASPLRKMILQRLVVIVSSVQIEIRIPALLEVSIAV
jgi:hypothetical protein